MMPRLLELFCGTKSVSKVFRVRGWEVVSLDLLSKFQPDICCDVLRWDFTQYPRGHFDFVWASPPCTEFSKAKTTGVRDLEGANRLVARAREIIDYFEPTFYCIENPVGLLRHQEQMLDLVPLRKTVSYCRYGFEYQKNTDLWSNVPFTPLVCSKGSYCNTKATLGHHSATVQKGTSKCKSHIKCTPQASQRYSLPPLLVESIFNSINRATPPQSHR